MAKWIPSQYNGYYTCSECANVRIDKEWAAVCNAWNYCPNCGAKMDKNIGSTEAKKYAPMGQEDNWA